MKNNTQETKFPNFYLFSNTPPDRIGDYWVMTTGCEGKKYRQPEVISISRNSGITWIDGPGIDPKAVFHNEGCIMYSHFCKAHPDALWLDVTKETADIDNLYIDKIINRVVKGLKSKIYCAVILYSKPLPSIPMHNEMWECKISSFAPTDSSEEIWKCTISHCEIFEPINGESTFKTFKEAIDGISKQIKSAMISGELPSKFLL